MAVTIGKGAPLWTASQNQPSVTVNEGLVVLDSSLSRWLPIDFPSDANYDLSTTGGLPQEWQRALIQMTDTGVLLTTGRDVIVPDNSSIYFFHNATAQILTFKTSAGTGIAVGVGKRAIVHCDNTNVNRWTDDISDSTLINSGPGSITSGGTTDVIAHGLAVTPLVQNIRITLSNNPTNTPGAIWVDTIGGTNFTVNCENDPGASNLDFGWFVDESRT